MGEVTQWKWCQKLKFDHTNKWYMQNQERDKLLCDTNVSPNLGQKTRTSHDHQKKILSNSRLCCLGRPHRKFLLKCEKRDKYQDITKEQNIIEFEGDTNCDQCFWDNFLRIRKGIRRLGNKRTRRDHTDYGIINIDQNTEKSPENLRRHDVAQILVKIHKLMLVWKTLKGLNNIHYYFTSCKNRS